MAIDTLPFAVCVTEPVTSPVNAKVELSRTISKFWVDDCQEIDAPVSVLLAN